MSARQQKRQARDLSSEKKKFGLGIIRKKNKSPLKRGGVEGRRGGGDKGKGSADEKKKKKKQSHISGSTGTTGKRTHQSFLGEETRGSEGKTRGASAQGPALKQEKLLQTCGKGGSFVGAFQRGWSHSWQGAGRGEPLTSITTKIGGGEGVRRTSLSDVCPQRKKGI